MKKEWQDIITKELGVKPIEICSSHFSAQQRKRLYWTNIHTTNELPTSNKVIADVLGLDIINKRENKIITTKANFKVKVRKHSIDKIEFTNFLRGYKNKTILEISNYCDAPKTMVEHWFRRDNSFSIPSDEYWNKLKECLGILDEKYDKAILEFEYKDNVFDMATRIYHIDGKHPTLTTLTNSVKKFNITNGQNMFSLNPNHCEILQTIPVDYTNVVSDRERYKMIGNGWTVDVISHIFKGLL